MNDHSSACQVAFILGPYLGRLNPAHVVSAVLAYCCGAAAAFGIGYTLLAGICMERFFARPSAAPTRFPSITIVKPLCGPEPALLANLVSFCEQDYPGTVQIIFGVNLASDPALEAVKILRRLHPAIEIMVVDDVRLHGSNRKVSNLLNMLPHARHEVLVFSDSDVWAPGHYLRSIIGELQQPGVGLVTCVYNGEPEGGIWARLSAMSTNYQFIPGAVTALSLGLARPCFGQTIAMSRSMLEKIGGLKQFADHLAEDHALGEAVRSAGHRVAIPSLVISHDCAESSFAKLVAHELRWNRTIRTVDPLGHLCSALAHPLPLAFLAAGFSGFAPWSARLIAAALIVRLALKVWADHLCRRSARDWWLQPFSDLVLFALFLISFLTARVTWRGFNFVVSDDGLLSAAKKE